MAMAGYDPNEAVTFWSRMAQTGGASPPEFLSTHPAHDTRISDLKKLVPEAMKYYHTTP
jgi:predicted Zn-dependent protease